MERFNSFQTNFSQENSFDQTNTTFQRLLPFQAPIFEQDVLESFNSFQTNVSQEKCFDQTNKTFQRLLPVMESNDDLNVTLYIPQSNPKVQLMKVDPISSFSDLVESAAFLNTKVNSVASRDVKSFMRNVVESLRNVPINGTEAIDLNEALCDLCLTVRKNQDLTHNLINLRTIVFEAFKHYTIKDFQKESHDIEMNTLEQNDDTQLTRVEIIADLIQSLNNIEYIPNILDVKVNENDVLKHGDNSEAKKEIHEIRKIKDRLFKEATKCVVMEKNLALKNLQRFLNLETTIIDTDEIPNLEYDFEPKILIQEQIESLENEEIRSILSKFKYFEDEDVMEVIGVFCRFRWKWKRSS